MCKQELVFVESILTSPLHRQTKSPTLWHNRFWLHKNFYEYIVQLDLSEHTKTLLTHEVRIVCRAGERHPRNYYGWQYARNFYKLWIENELSAGRHIEQSFLEDITTSIISWCRNNPTDISGWSFLSFLLLDSRQKASFVYQALGNVQDYILKYTSRQESPWIFQRTMIASGAILPSQRSSLIRQIAEACQDELERTKCDYDHAERAVFWIEKYQV